MSSNEPVSPGPGDDARPDEVTAPHPDASVESPPADPGVADPEPGAADRAPEPAPGAPGELRSDEDVSGDDGPAVTETSNEAADDVPVIDEAVEGTDAPEAPEGGDTRAEGVEAPASTGVDDPGAAVADQPDEPAAGEGTVTAAAPAVAPAGETAEGEVIPEDASTQATTTTEPAVAEPEPEPAPIDEARQPLIDLLAERLGEGLVATHVDHGRDLTVRVTRDVWVEAAEVCRDALGMTYFGFLSAIDWMPSPYGRSEDGGLSVPTAPTEATFEAGTTGGNTRFQLLARLECPKAPSLGLTLKCDLPGDDLAAPTWTGVFPGADWHERETAEMFGIDFRGHPNLVKLYLPGAFEGHPLRKDFPLLARDVKPWPGLVDVEAMPGEDEPTTEEADA